MHPSHYNCASRTLYVIFVELYAYLLHRVLCNYKKSISREYTHTVMYYTSRCVRFVQLLINEAKFSRYLELTWKTGEARGKEEREENGTREKSRRLIPSREKLH